jgi:hypothetical protein
VQPSTATICNYNTLRSKNRCALRLRYVDLVVRIEGAVEVCCCFTVFSCSVVIQRLKRNAGKVFSCYYSLWFCMDALRHHFQHLL